ncbi:MAG TPA: hypothetical protein VMR25_19935 [Planctomycetaceae bacterium]|jgi:hypothetical protein|nr:hypothetical protein [Planctomycetaceae bacterium]
MSEAKQRPHAKWWLQWESVVLLAFAVGSVLAFAYEGAHYATSAVVQEPGCCCPTLTHTIGGKQVPRWVDKFFWLAHEIDSDFRWCCGL